jgi:hypothetical protein
MHTLPEECKAVFLSTHVESLGPQTLLVRLDQFVTSFRFRTCSEYVQDCISGATKSNTRAARAARDFEREFPFVKRAKQDCRTIRSYTIIACCLRDKRQTSVFCTKECSSKALPKANICPDTSWMSCKSEDTANVHKTFAPWSRGRHSRSSSLGLLAPESPFPSYCSKTSPSSASNSSTL